MTLVSKINALIDEYEDNLLASLDKSVDNLRYDIIELLATKAIGDDSMTLVSKINALIDEYEDNLLASLDKSVDNLRYDIIELQKYAGKLSYILEQLGVDEYESQYNISAYADAIRYVKNGNELPAMHTIKNSDLSKAPEIKS